MNLEKYQDRKLMHRNLLHSYTLMMKNLKENLWKHFHLTLQIKNKIPRNKPTQGDKRPVCRKLWHWWKKLKSYKQMERYIMFLDWKNQHCENDSTTQSNLQIQCNPFQTTNGIFHRTRTKSFTICMETQKTPNSQSNLEKEKRSWRNQAP